MKWLYDKDGNGQIVENDVFIDGMFDTPFGRNTAEDKPKEAPPKPNILKSVKKKKKAK